MQIHHIKYEALCRKTLSRKTIVNLMGKPPLGKETYPKNVKNTILMHCSQVAVKKVLFEHLFFAGELTWIVYMITDTDSGVLVKKKKKKLEMQMTMG